MKYLWIVLITLISCAITNPAHAACTSTPAGDLPGWGPTVTLNACNKTISAVTGVDWATDETSTVNSSALTITENSILTINNGGHLAVGTLTIAPGSSVSIAAGADIKIGTPLYIEDADADGFAVTTINLAELSTSTRSGTRRLAFMRAWTADCGDSQYASNNSCCVASTYYVDADGDGYGYGGPISMCPAAGYVANNSDCNDSMSGYRYPLGTRFYIDNDVDTYTNGSQIAGIAICSNASTWDTSVNWSAPGNGSLAETFTLGSRRNAASATTDCNDANSAIYPNSCDGNTAYNAVCATTTCATSTGTCETGGGCSAGSCVPVSYTANGSMGPGCTNITNYRCDGAGNCTAPVSTGCYPRVSWSRCSDECVSAIGAINCKNSYTDVDCTAGINTCTTLLPPYCKCTIYQYDWNPPGG